MIVLYHYMFLFRACDSSNQYKKLVSCINNKIEMCFCSVLVW